MKEILYVQAGRTANAVGTHFFNTQEAYFTYEGEGDPLTRTEVSFRQSYINADVVYCPRVLIFDQKESFGNFAKTNLLDYSFADEAGGASSTLWYAPFLPIRRMYPIPIGRYHASLNHQFSAEVCDDDLIQDLVPEDSQNWSDYNLLYYDPHSVQSLPDGSSFSKTMNNWATGQEDFSRHAKNFDVMETSVRYFVEECDTLQGIQLMNDTSTFGSFMTAFLTSFRDEFPKLPSLTIPFMSSAIPGGVEPDDVLGLARLVIDAYYLRQISDLSSANVPILHLSTCPREISHGRGIHANPKNMYEMSAILSAHIETATLPLRLAHEQEDLSSFTSHLNWRGNTPFSTLRGMLPLRSGDSLDPVSDLSLPGSLNTDVFYARRDVSRGFSPSLIAAYDEWCTRLPLSEILVTRCHAPSYPLPSSFPTRIFAERPQKERTGLSGVGVFSSMSTSSATSQWFSSYAIALENIRENASAMGRVTEDILDADEYRELINSLWMYQDNYMDGSSTTGGAEDADDDI
ncbi:tubulin nucleotide-binding domain-like protein [Fistulina hepatica ATCC 64428]|uniref:Tubulin nucleotide-binding domain-like protein n=1 Tax=Fistulina hepatica ATCC 64428 TaxID=1128425 RepID=A0A0D7A120_9AGAR|nr:tubulin nucleotide-binding domain-like protein [Fistulina hepatica ATCC 64428]